MPDLAAWLNEISAASPLAFALVAAAGLAVGVAPSSLPMVSVIVGWTAARSDDEPGTGRAQAVLLSLGFVLGMATVDTAVGALSGLIGFTVIRALAGYLALTNLALAAVLAILGLALLRKLRLPWLTVRPTPRPATSFATAYGLGIPFGLAACPACTPMVLPVLAAAAGTGLPWLAAALLLTFGLARGLPIAVAGTAAGSVKHLRRLAPWVPRIEKAGGALLLVAAVYFLYQSGVYRGLFPPLQAMV